MATQTKPISKFLDYNLIKSTLEKDLTTFNKVGKAVQLRGEKEMEFVLVAMQKTPLLRECTIESIRDAYMMCANVGLSLNPVFQHAAIIPIYNKDRSCYEAALWPMYRGLIKLAADYGLVSSVTVENVYKADEFKVWRDHEGDKFTHVIAHTIPRDTPENPYLGTYVVARRKSESLVVTWVPAEDILKMKLSSRNYDNTKPDDKQPGSVWVKWKEEMCRKGALKRAQKYWVPENSKTPERMQAAVQLDNWIEGTVLDRSESPIPAQIDPPKKINAEQLAILSALLKDSKVNPEKFRNVYFVAEIKDLPADQFEEAKDRLEKARDAAKSKKKTREPGEDG